ncbi:MAG: glycosyltransferase family 2 protein [Eubacteriales bacterium]|nr:glycosyltransferase family 2 protein [Eubacteriales bacterium]
MKKANDLISLIIPCYNEQEALPILYEELGRTAKLLPDYETEFLFIDDGSRDRTRETILSFAASDERVRYYGFSRNFGKEAAMYAGFCNARGDYVAVMDADMQDPPSLLPRMMELLQSGEYDSVATRRADRAGEPALRSMFARMFYRLIRTITDTDIVDGARDFRLMKREMVEAVLAMSEYNRFSKGIFGWIGFRTCWLPFENRERSAGKTKWNFWKLFKYSLDGIMGFSHVPLELASWSGIALTAVSFLSSLFIAVRRILFGDPVPGWPSLACIITFIGGVQLFCIGIMGQYLAKTYLEVKKRPHYIISETNAEDAVKIK